MSRRKLHWRKVLGSPAAPRIGTKTFDTHESGAGGSVEKVMLNIPSRNVRGLKSEDIGTRPMGDRKIGLLKSWLK